MKNPHVQDTHPNRIETLTTSRPSLTRRAVVKLIPSLAIVLGIMASPISSSASLLGYYPLDVDTLDYSGTGTGMKMTGVFGAANVPTIQTGTKKLGIGAYRNPVRNGLGLVRSEGPGNPLDRDFANFSFSCWIDPDNTWGNNQTRDYLICGRTGLGYGGRGWNFVRFRGNGSLILGVSDGYDGTVQTASAAQNGLPGNVWHHVAFTYHQLTTGTAEMKVYLDGQLSGTSVQNCVAFPNANNAPMAIGNTGANRSTSSAMSLLGYLDDAGVWDECITDQKMAAIFGLGTLAGVTLGDKYPSHAASQVDELVAAFNTSGSSIAGGYTWNYDAGTGANPVGFTSGSVAGGDAFIVLNASGAGMKVGAAVDVLTLSTSIAGVNHIFLAVGDADPNITITVPTAAVAASNVDVTITSASPSVAIPTGAVVDSVTVTLTMGGANTTNVPIHAVAGGTAIFSASNPALLTQNTITVHTPQLVGHWISGAPTLADSSGYQPAGTHDGVAVGPNATAIAFSSDVPAGMSGLSLDLNVGNVAVAIKNSATTDPGYKNTFDDELAYNSTISFWAKGLPSENWAPWISKYGEGSGTAGPAANTPATSGFGDAGWQVRRVNNSVNAAFTIRNTPGSDDPQGNVDVSSPTTWHHFTAIRNGVTGTRQLYIDGALDTSVNLTGDNGAMGMACLAKLVLGGRNQGPSDSQVVVNTYSRMDPISLFDVRVYNGAINVAQIPTIMGTDPNVVAGIHAAVAEPIVMTAGDPDLTSAIEVYVPPAALVSASVTVNLSSSAPGVAAPVTTVLVFPMGGGNTQVVDIHAGSAGVASITASSPDIAVKGSVGVTVNAAMITGLIGRWFSGAASYADTAGAQPAGTHDAMPVGPNPGNASFSSDVPPGYTGQSINISGNEAIMIANSATTDTGYKPTYDSWASSAISITFWAKDLPGGWNPWVSKRGEDDKGWQVRQHGDGLRGCFTLRGSPDNDDPKGNILITSATTRWHHYAAVWDGTAGTRKLYVDGALDSGVNLTADAGAYTPAPVHHVVIGAREKSTDFGLVENQSAGKFYDVRVYNQAISVPQIQTLMTPTVGKVAPVLVEMNVGDPDSSMTVSVPASLLISGSVDVILNSDNAGAAVPTVSTVHFAMGGGNSAVVPVHAVGAGVANITGSSGSVAVGGTVTVNVTQPTMVGHWISGAANFAETSGFQPAGIHDGYVVGGTPANQSFSSDVPTNFSGQSLVLAGDVGVAIANSSTTDGAYSNTFDQVIQSGCTIAFWAKGFPNSDWNPWISKQGEDNAWQVRRIGGSSHAGFTLRGTPSEDEPEGTVDLSAGTDWHHYAAVWDGVYGARMLYIDGVVDPGTFIDAADFGPMGLQSNSHLVLGGKDQGGFGSFSPLQLFDVRIYDKALSEYAISKVMIPTVGPPLKIVVWTGGQVRISWPAAATGFTLQSTASLSPTSWASAGLSVSVEGSENAAYAPASSAAFYRLLK